MSNNSINKKINIETVDEKELSITSRKQSDTNNEPVNDDFTVVNIKKANEPNDESIDRKMFKFKSELYDTMTEYVAEEMDRRREEIIATLKRDIEEKGNESKDSSNASEEGKRQFSSRILKEYIYPDNEETIKNLLNDKSFYSGLLQVTRGFKLVIAALVVPALILSETKFPGYGLGYAAGVISALGALLETADQMIVRSNKTRLKKINDVLESVGIKYRLPDTTLENVTDPNASSKRQSVIMPSMFSSPSGSRSRSR